MVQPIRSELLNVGLKHLASGRPGAMGSRCWVVVSWGTCGGASGASIGVADHCVPTKGPTQVMVETVGAGPESQSASWICLVGPSSVMNASDLDVHSFVP